MKTKTTPVRTTKPDKSAGRLRTACAKLLLLLLTLPVAAQAQEEDYTYSDNGDGTITITGYIGSGGDVAVPDRIDGFLVTSIGDYAFFNCTSLNSIWIGNSITSIGVPGVRL